MNFSQFCKGLHPKLSGISSQGQLVGSLFNAAGSSFFPSRPAYDTDSYQRKLYGGTKPLTQEMKDSFPKPIDTEGFESFLQTRIGDASLTQIMANFSIPADDIQDKAAFTTALCAQFQCIIEEAENEVDDIVAKEYSRLLKESGTASAKQYPLYPGDDLLLVSETPSKPHTVCFYEEFEHQWVIKNTGSVVWDGRNLECTNQSTTRIRALNPAIGIPKIPPGKEVSLLVRLNARGFEGSYESIWVMKDNDGRVCFPDEGKALKFSATVENRGGEPAEVC